MLNVGIVGIGFMGMIHYLAYQKAQGVQVSAICTRSKKKRAGDWRGIQGNFGPPGEMMDLAGVATYAKLESLLEDDALDVVDVCLPPAMHADVCEAALSAGKHVFCEKPIAVTCDDASRMASAAGAAGKQLMIGHVLPFFPEFDFAYQATRSGRYGRLLGGHFKRIISDPSWLKDFYDPALVGGPLVDLHIHDAHFIRLLCGMPRAVFSTGRLRGDVVEFVNTQFLFDDGGVSVTASGGVINQQGRPFTHAFEMYFEKASLLFDFAVIDGEPVVATPLTVLEADGKVTRPELGSGDPVDGFVAEAAEMARAISSGEASPLLDGELACDALRLCHAQAESVKSGTLVEL